MEVTRLCEYGYIAAKARMVDWDGSAVDEVGIAPLSAASALCVTDACSSLTPVRYTMPEP